MVGRWGMSESIGPIAVLPSATARARCCRASRRSREATQEIVDREVRRIVDTAHAEVTRLLTEHRDQLDSLTDALLEAETLDEADAYVAARRRPRRPREPTRQSAAAGDRRRAAS